MWSSYCFWMKISFKLAQNPFGPFQEKPMQDSVANWLWRGGGNGGVRDPKIEGNPLTQFTPIPTKKRISPIGSIEDVSLSPPLLSSLPSLPSFSPFLSISPPSFFVFSFLLSLLPLFPFSRSLSFPLSLYPSPHLFSLTPLSEVGLHLNPP